MKPLLIHYTRGKVIESSHSVHALWLDDKSCEIQSWGEADKIVCPRSALKPIQTLALIKSKAYEKSPDPLKAIAIATASHWAQDRHLDFVRAWLKLLGYPEESLACGFEPPDDYARILELIKEHRTMGKVFNNCSGKHTAMIATCLAERWPALNYHHWDHPLQKQIRQIGTDLSGMQWDQLPWGLDGCSLPNYHLPLRVFATAISKIWFMSHRR